MNCIDMCVKTEYVFFTSFSLFLLIILIYIIFGLYKKLSKLKYILLILLLLILFYFSFDYQLDLCGSACDSGGFLGIRGFKIFPSWFSNLLN